MTKFQETTRKLLIKFLKMHGQMHLLYYRYHIQCDRGAVGYFLNVEDAYICLTSRDKNALVLSQLWRFYVLKNIFKYPRGLREQIYCLVKDEIESNGTRYNEEVEKLFDEYGFEPYRRKPIFGNY